MPDRDLRDLASYLVSCSATSLGSFYLAKLDLRSHLERSLRELVRQLADVAAAAQLAELLRQHDEEGIIASASVARQPILVERDAAPAKWKASHYGAGNWFAVAHAPDTMLSTINKLVLIMICTTIPESHNFSKSWDWEELGQLCSISGDYARSVVEGDLIWRRILKRHGAGKATRMEFIVCPQSEWRDRTNSKPIAGKKGYVAKVKRPRRAEIRINVREQGPSEVWGERCGDFPKTPYTGETVLQLTLGGSRRTVRPLPGPLEIRYTQGSPTETEELIAGNQMSPSTEVIAGNQPEPQRAAEADLAASDQAGLSTPLIAGNQTRPSTPLIAGNQTRPSTPLIAGNHVQTVKQTEMVRTRIPVMEGHIWVTHPTGTKPYTKRERIKMAKEFGGQPRAETLAKRFRDQSFEAEIVFRPDWKGWPQPLAAQPKPARERVVLTSLPSSVWDQMLRQMESAPPSSPMRVNPHTFSTWLRPTSEEGRTADGTLVIRVPSRPFRRRLSEALADQIGRAFAAVTGERRPLLVKYVVGEEEDVVHEIVPPSGEPQATTNRKEHRAYA